MAVLIAVVINPKEIAITTYSVVCAEACVVLIGYGIWRVIEWVWRVGLREAVVEGAKIVGVTVAIVVGLVLLVALWFVPIPAAIGNVMFALAIVWIFERIASGRYLSGHPDAPPKYIELDKDNRPILK